MANYDKFFALSKPGPDGKVIFEIVRRKEYVVFVESNWRTAQALADSLNEGRENIECD